MKYRDLIQFDPIESVVQLYDANAEETARQHVSSFVISDEMAERLTDVVFQQLRVDHAADNNGLLVVGNYGTGKSHLMSVISSIAEREELAKELHHEDVAKAAEPIAGKFKVVRTELGSTEMDFREFVCSQLQEALQDWGISFEFPPRDQIPNHKTVFEDMMTAFHDTFPDHGLLLVVDELLDYLRSRKDQEIVLDLNFLREIGEICNELRFRFIAGVQERLFENTQFAFVSESLQRVHERFEQVPIATRDIKHVASERLLQKTPEQQGKVREHLLPFAKFYGDMNERIEEFVRLFPIHPEFINTFQEMTMIEKREVLKTLSRTMQARLDEDVPDDAPGIISYDTYWQTLSENRALHSQPEVHEVVTCSEKLESRIQNAFPRPAYKPMAIKIIHGLSIHRLTTGDIYAPVGATPEELRDALCLYDPMVAELGGDDPAADLLSHVETVLREIHRTMSGQFISVNDDNRQYYLDPQKQEDYDELIAQRAELLDENKLDRYYFEALKQVLECTDQTYVTGYNIWQHQLEWEERRASREGYLFFGAPNERSTAVPPRDFYMYFLQPYDPPYFRDEKQKDEVLFKLADIDEDFSKSLRTFAAAHELAQTSSGQKQRTYRDKGNAALKEVVRWLQQHMATAVQVTYQGRTKQLAECVKTSGPSAGQDEINIRDMVNAAAGRMLASYFAELAPEYPAFSVLIMRDNRKQAAQDAIRGIAGERRTKQAIAVLDALELLDGDRVNPGESRYAEYLREMLANKGQGQVVNRSEIIKDVNGVEYMAPERFRLEPEWVAVILAALVYTGEVVVAIPGQKFDATNLNTLANTAVTDLMDFKHLERPKELNMAGIEALFETLNLSPGLAKAIPNNEDDPIQELQKAINDKVKALVEMQESLKSGVILFGTGLLSESEHTEHASRIEETRQFLEALQVFNTPGKMRNFTHSTSEVNEKTKGLQSLQELQNLMSSLSQLSPLANYLSQAEMALPSEHELLQKIYDIRQNALSTLSVREHRSKPGQVNNLAREMQTLKDEYIDTYMEMHDKYRLGADDDEKKKRLTQDSRFAKLQSLATVSLMPKQQLTEFQNELAKVTTCFSLTKEDLDASPLCPHCNFRPANAQLDISASQHLANLDDRLDNLYQEWTQTLLDNLENDPTIKQNLELLKPDARKMLEDFIAQKELPDSLSQSFISALNEVLSGLTPVKIQTEDLREALLSGGTPVTPEEMVKRFQNYLQECTKGNESDKVRIVLE